MKLAIIEAWNVFMIRHLLRKKKIKTTVGYNRLCEKVVHLKGAKPAISIVCKGVDSDWHQMKGENASYCIYSSETYRGLDRNAAVGKAVRLLNFWYLV